MAQAAEVADLVQRDGLEIEASARPAADGPGERRVEEDVGLEELAGDFVDQKARRRQHAIELGLVEEPERRPAVVVAG